MSTINTQFQFTAEKPKITKAAAFVKSTKFLGGEKTVVDQLKEAKKSGKSIIVIDALHQSADAYKAAFDGEFKGVFKKVIFYSKEPGTLYPLLSRLTLAPKKSASYVKTAVSALAGLAIGAVGYYFISAEHVANDLITALKNLNHAKLVESQPSLSQIGM